MFLEKLAQHIIRDYEGNLQDSCFVFPNRRSGLFFRRFLAANIRNSIWSPRIITINELMIEISGMDLADPLDLMFRLHDQYVKIASNAETFDKFYPWGEVMLSDFDTMDKYMVDTASVFRNILDLKEIDEVFGELEEEQVEFIRSFWKSFHQGNVTDEKKVFLSTWKILPLLYNGLRQDLIDSGEGYEGLIYRKVAETEIADFAGSLKSVKYFFVGFNALSASEKVLFTRMKNSGAADFFWDYDDYYVKDEYKEAGRFLRENIRLFPPPSNLGIFNSLSRQKKVRIYDLPSDVLQSKTVHRLLSDREAIIEDANDTAIIACDEKLLMPLLVSLPGQVDKVNVTMGYPFVNTPLYSFINGVLRLYLNGKEGGSFGIRYYYKDVLSILNHPYYRMFPESKSLQVAEKIIRENRVYVDPSFFTDDFSKEIFNKVIGPGPFCEMLARLLSTILLRLEDVGPDLNKGMEREYILVMLTRLNKITELIRGRSVELSMFIKLFRKLLSNLRIPFTGEPLAGLQIMGILETRLLDFRHVIMLSVNEEIMPRSTYGHSFVPYSLRYAYGLPTREDADAIYAFYFYRLLQRAEKVDLLYKSAAEGIRSGEMSRYLYQMRYDFGAEIVHPTMPIIASGKPVIEIRKNPEIMQILGKYLAGNDSDHYLSPSALNSYIECSLRFYFRKVLAIGEKDDLLEELDRIGFGNILHRTIDVLYSELAGEEGHITLENLESLSSGNMLKDTLRSVFIREFFKNDRNREIEGRNIIILAILERYIKRILEIDAGIAPLKLLGLEESFVDVLDIDSPEGSIRVNIGGKIDRIDRLANNLVRIIDYKTGKSETRFESIQSLFDSNNKSRNKEAFQAFMYAMIYLGKHPGTSVQPGLYVVRQLFGESFEPHFVLGGKGKSEPVLDFGPYMDVYKLGLENVLADIFDKNVPFIQTAVAERCRYCDFKAICQRE